MADWTTPIAPEDNIIRKGYWKSTIVDNLTVLNDILGNTDGGHVSLTDGGILLGNGTGAIVAMAALAKGSLVAGDGAADPIAQTVGANDRRLLADSSQASGIFWEDASNWDVAEVLLHG